MLSIKTTRSGLFDKQHSSIMTQATREARNAANKAAGKPLPYPNDKVAGEVEAPVEETISKKKRGK